MSTQRIFVVWTHRILLKSLQALLNHPQIEWLGECSTQGNFLEILAAQKPDIVLLEDNTGEYIEKTLQLIETAQANLRVIQLNLDGNDIHLYQVEMGTIQKKEDLLNLILKE